MPKAKKKADQPIHTHLSIKLTSHETRISAGINYAITDPKFAEPESPIYEFQSILELTGECTYPDERAGEVYTIEVFGHEPYKGQFTAILNDYRARDTDGDYKYRKRGKELIPVYEPPDSIGHIERRRGTKIWQGYAWIAPAIVNDMLVLLSYASPLHIELHEVKVNRNRRIREVSLQTIASTNE